MTVANKLTVLRLFIPLAFIPALAGVVPHGKAVALLLFVLGIVTDWLDGFYARRYGCVSDFGRLMDPLADKILVTSALICFVRIEPQIVATWMVVAIIAREFVVTGLRLLALQSRVVISAEALGKHKTAWQMIGIVSLLIFYALLDMQVHLPIGLLQWVQQVAPLFLLALMYVVTGLTLISGALYLWRYRALYAEHL